MGLFDYVTVNDPRFVCSNNHDLSAEEFQSKDFGCEMGHVAIEHGCVSSHARYFGTHVGKVEIYCVCTQCPAFVQFGTGNLVGCDVLFEIALESDMEGDIVKSILRTSPSTKDWLHDVPLERHMHRCEGPMPYTEARQLHVHYRKLRVEQSAEFDRWSRARAKALTAREPWPLSLHVGEYPDEKP